MDSVILFFGTRTHAEIEEAAQALGVHNGTLTREDSQVYLHRYLEADWVAELDADERATIEGMLGGPIRSAFQVSCRHDASARLALEIVSALMDSQAPAVLDDDFRGVWAAAELSVRLRQSSSVGLFDLRTTNTEAH
jgi:hypothetical protein